MLGGSWFVGAELVAQALCREHEVSVFNRGRSCEAPFGARQIRGDWERQPDLAALAGHGPWDAVIDVAGAVPAIVGNTARALAGVADRYVFISTVSAYRDWPHAPISEASPLWVGDPDRDPGTRAWDPDAYGPLKVGCELAVAQVFDAAHRLVLRPHVVLGPREYVGRLAWWLDRMRRGGAVLAPGPDRPIQPVDVRDLAGFALDRTEAGAAGVYNVAGAGRETYGHMLSACAAEVADVAEEPARLVWVDENWLVDQGVAEWTELPLWRNAAAPWGMETGPARADGLVCRPLAETVADTWAWLRDGGRPVEHERRVEHGIAPDREAQLLRAWHESMGRWQGS